MNSPLAKRVRNESIIPLLFMPRYTTGADSIAMLLMYSAGSSVDSGSMTQFPSSSTISNSKVFSSARKKTEKEKELIEEFEKMNKEY